MVIPCCGEGCGEESMHQLPPLWRYIGFFRVLWVAVDCDVSVARSLPYAVIIPVELLARYGVTQFEAKACLRLSDGEIGA